MIPAVVTHAAVGHGSGGGWLRFRGPVRRGVRPEGGEEVAVALLLFALGVGEKGELLIGSAPDPIWTLPLVSMSSNTIRPVEEHSPSRFRRHGVFSSA